jgi:hypothetical protein
MRPNTNELAEFAGVGKKSSSYDKTQAELRRLGLATLDEVGWSITADGFAAIGRRRMVPVTAEDQQRLWVSVLPPGPRAFLEALVGAYPHALGRDELSVRTGYSTTSSSFDKAVSVLRRNGLVDRSRLRAADWLFEAPR